MEQLRHWKMCFFPPFTYANTNTFTRRSLTWPDRKPRRLQHSKYKRAVSIAGRVAAAAHLLNVSTFADRRTQRLDGVGANAKVADPELSAVQLRGESCLYEISLRELFIFLRRLGDANANIRIPPLPRAAPGG